MITAEVMLMALSSSTCMSLPPFLERPFRLQRVSNCSSSKSSSSVAPAEPSRLPPASAEMPRRNVACRSAKTLFGIVTVMPASLAGATFQAGCFDRYTRLGLRHQSVQVLWQEVPSYQHRQSWCNNSCSCTTACREQTLSLTILKLLSHAGTATPRHQVSSFCFAIAPDLKAIEEVI